MPSLRSQKYSWYFTAAIFAYFILVIFLGHWCLTYYPNTGDEHSVLFQAKIFSRFHISAPAPPFPEFFASHHLEITNGQWFSIYPPLYPLILAPGIWLGYPLFEVALLSCVGLVLLHGFLLRIGESRVSAGMTVFIFAVSPSYLFHSASLYTHVGTFLILLLMLHQVDGWGPGQRLSIRNPVLLGILAGAGLGIRTYTTVLACLPLFAVVLHCIAKKTLSLPSFLKMALSFYAVGALVVVINNFHSGHWLDLQTVQNLALQGGVPNGYYSQAPFSWLKMVLNGLCWTFGAGPWVLNNLKSEPWKSEPWSCLWWVAIVILLCAGVWIAKKRMRSRSALLVLLGLLGALTLGHFDAAVISGRFGERHFFEIHFVYVFLAVQALLGISRKLGLSNRATVSLALLLLIPMTASSVGTALAIRRDNLRRMDLFLQLKALPISGKKRLVFIKETPDFDPTFYTRNEPDLSGDILARDLGPRDKLLRVLYPNADAYEYLRSGGQWILRRYAD